MLNVGQFLTALLLASITTTVWAAGGCEKEKNQLDLNTCTAREYFAVDKLMNEQYQTHLNSIRTGYKQPVVTAYMTAQKNFLRYRESYCNYVELSYTNGSGAPAGKYVCMTKLTKARMQVMNTVN